MHGHRDMDAFLRIAKHRDWQPVTVESPYKIGGELGAC